jgi:hypothetical protein
MYADRNETGAMEIKYNDYMLLFICDLLME